jgi:HK97 family phage major capsid protein
MSELNLTQLREKAAAKQDELGKVFAEALISDGGEKKYDFNRVTVLGPDVKGSIAVAEKVEQLNNELNDICAKAETLEAAEKAAAQHAERSRAVRGFPFPGGKGNHPNEQARIKSLGELIAENEQYKAYAARGAVGGLDLGFGELLLSDMLAKGEQFATLGSKTLMTTSAGFAPESIRLPGYTEAVTRPIQLLDIIPMFPTTQAAIKYMEETTRTHAAAETAEGGSYAESTFAFTERTSSVAKITDSVPVTDEQLEDVAMMQGYLNSRLTFGVRQRLDRQVLIGDGSSPNLRGLKNVSGIQTQAKGADPVPDAFFKAMTKVRVTGRAVPTHHVMHPTDWQGVRLLRTADGIYIWGSPAETGPERLWGLPVVQNDADSAGTGYTGSFQPAWCSLFEKRGVDVQVGYVGSQFTEGKRTVRADARAAMVWMRPAAFCSVTGL